MKRWNQQRTNPEKPTFWLTKVVFFEFITIIFSSGVKTERSIKISTPSACCLLRVHHHHLQFLVKTERSSKISTEVLGRCNDKKVRAKRIAAGVLGLDHRLHEEEKVGVGEEGKRVR